MNGFISQVGNYEDSSIEQLVPLSRMNLDPEIEALFRCVFVADPTERPTATDLLNHPIFREGSHACGDLL